MKASDDYKSLIFYNSQGDQIVLFLKVAFVQK